MDPTREDQVDGSAKGRLNAWGFAWNLAKDSPIWGGGYSTFTEELFSRYAPNAMDFHGPHSVYFQLLGEHGFVGLGLYLTIIACAYGKLFRLARYARARDDTTILIYVNMFRASLLGFMVNGVFLGRAYFDYFFTIVACVAVLTPIAEDMWTQEDEEEETNALEQGVILSPAGLPLLES
jgi:probable O-glycosylation ligase (exosortase A-associated)